MGVTPHALQNQSGVSTPQRHHGTNGVRSRGDAGKRENHVVARGIEVPPRPSSWGSVVIHFCEHHAGCGERGIL